MSYGTICYSGEQRPSMTLFSGIHHPLQTATGFSVLPNCASLNVDFIVLISVFADHLSAFKSAVSFA